MQKVQKNKNRIFIFKITIDFSIVFLLNKNIDKYKPNNSSFYLSIFFNYFVPNILSPASPKPGTI